MQFLQHHPFVARFIKFVQFFLLASAKKNYRPQRYQKKDAVSKHFLRRAKKKPDQH